MNLIKSIKYRYSHKRKYFRDSKCLYDWAEKSDALKGDSLFHAEWLRDFGCWTREFSGRYFGEDVVLLCNGPSLNKIDFELLKGKHLIGLNKIHLLLETVDLKLAFHVAINRLVIEQSIEEFEKLVCPSFVSARGLQEEARTETSCHLLSTGTENKSPYFCHDMVRAPICEGWTVTYAALQLAYYMGFQNVYITGMDHNFKCSGNPNEKQTLNEPDPNHFDPRYFSGNSWQLPDLEGSEISYRLAKFAYERSGRKIFDATVGGHCDIFDKVDFFEAMKRFG